MTDGHDQYGDAGDGSDRRTVELPSALVADIEQRIEQTEFESVEGYARCALQLLVRELDRRDTTGSNKQDLARHDEPESADDERGEDEAIRDRLESLGYL